MYPIDKFRMFDEVSMLNSEEWDDEPLDWELAYELGLTPGQFSSATGTEETLTVN